MPDHRGRSRSGSSPDNRRIRVSLMLPHVSPDLHLLGAPKTLTIAVYTEFFPVAYRDPKTRDYAGLDVDLVRGFCTATGLKPRFVRFSDFDAVVDSPGRWNDRVDCAIGGIGRSSWRTSDAIEWSVPYFRVQRTVVFALRDPIRSFPDGVTGKIAGTMGSTGMDDAFDRMEAAGKRHLLDIRWKTTDAKDLRDLLDGRIQGLMRGSFVGRALVRQHPKQLGMLTPWAADPSSVGPGGEVFAFPCRRGSGLAAALTAYLIRLSENGELATLIQKHDML
jgi:ABC-type amino acid transport substrate-binding protein